MRLFLAWGVAVGLLTVGSATRPGTPTAQIQAGWSDEFFYESLWHPLGIINQANVTLPKPGRLKLSLNKVPADWPYQYQWSGVTRDIMVDIGRFPFLIASVPEVNGYAHLDIDVLNAKLEPVKGFRSTTTQAAGCVFIDLGANLDPAIYRLRLRLIVGGSNDGCSVTYYWVRFCSSADGQRLLLHPDLPTRTVE
ncbi:MAG: hypothetical protein JST40_05820 [Armatimonadetes bacterium]|nr:hypothetical protein [Armatimonadota bacterium]